MCFQISKLYYERMCATVLTKAVQYCHNNGVIHCLPNYTNNQSNCPDLSHTITISNDNTAATITNLTISISMTAFHIHPGWLVHLQFSWLVYVYLCSLYQHTLTEQHYTTYDHQATICKLW